MKGIFFNALLRPLGIQTKKRKNITKQKKIATIIAIVLSTFHIYFFNLKLSHFPRSHNWKRQDWTSNP